MTSKFVLGAVAIGMSAGEVRADKIDDFVRSQIDPRTTDITAIHPNASFFIFHDSQQFFVDSKRIKEIIDEQKTEFSSVSITEFHIISKTETYPVTSVVYEYSFIAKGGSTSVSGHAVSHDIILDEDGKLMDVFSAQLQ